jgi:hypothetical protein
MEKTEVVGERGKGVRSAYPMPMLPDCCSKRERQVGQGRAEGVIQRRRT